MVHDGTAQLGEGVERRNAHWVVNEHGLEVLDREDREEARLHHQHLESIVDVGWRQRRGRRRRRRRGSIAWPVDCAEDSTGKDSEEREQRQPQSSSRHPHRPRHRTRQ